MKMALQPFYDSVNQKDKPDNHFKPAGGKVSRLIIMNTYYSRLVVEKEELDERRENLNNFLESDRINSIDPVQMSLLNIQSMAMLTYSQVLAERIARIGATTEQVTS
jgi:hypothetical protein